MAANEPLPEQVQQGPLRIGLLINGECIARVIGKQGAGLRHIRESTGCKLLVAAPTDESTAPRRVTITGHPHAVGMAVQQALMKAFSDATLQTRDVEVFIPPEVAGIVIGKAGANLKKVREFFAVRLEVMKEVNDGSYGPERKILMTGPCANMGQALGAALVGGVVPFMTPGSPGVLALPTPQHESRSSSMLCVDVRQVSADPEEIQLHMVVHDKFVGALLGKEGSQIKQLAASTGCKLCMTNKDLGERRVVLIGKHSQCEAAQKVLQEILVEAGQQANIDVSSVTIIFYVRSTAVGAVIGKGGAQLKRIREQTGAKVQVERDEIQGQRPCPISGSSKQVMKAVGMVHDLLCSEPDGEFHDAACSKHAVPLAVMAAPSPGKAASIANAKRQRVDGEGGVTKLLVPAKSAGSVIGKQGSGLARIRERCGVRLWVLTAMEAPQWQTIDHRVVILEGPLNNRKDAATAVLHAAFQADAASHLKMLVPNAEAGAVIGKQGGVLKTIREQCGIRVFVQKEDVYGERLVSAEGPLESATMVAHWVMWSIEGRDSVDPVPEPPASAVGSFGAYSAEMLVGPPYDSTPVKL